MTNFLEVKNQLFEGLTFHDRCDGVGIRYINCTFNNCSFDNLTQKVAFIRSTFDDVSWESVCMATAKSQIEYIRRL